MRLREGYLMNKYCGVGCCWVLSLAMTAPIFALDKGTAGQTPLTKLLNDTRHQRYRLFKLVAQEALNVGEDVIEESSRL